MFETEVPKLRQITEKKKQAYEALKEFHQEYIDGAVRQFNTIHSIMDKICQLMPPKIVGQAIAREEPIQ